MQNKHIPYGPYERFFKRPFDILCAALAIVAFWWLYLIVAVLVRIKLGSPVIFTQERPGRIDKNIGQEKIFKLYKFRTMTNEKDAEGNLLPDEVRLTKFGKWLRSTSLDEIPEVFNILKGDMSIVAPRPLLVEYLPFYTKEERLRHAVRPGLTGLAQISGRNCVEWDQRLALDVSYVQKITFLGDLKILIKTVGKVFEKDGIATETGKVESNFAKERISMVFEEDKG